MDRASGPYLDRASSFDADWMTLKMWSLASPAACRRRNAGRKGRNVVSTFFNYKKRLRQDGKGESGYARTPSVSAMTSTGFLNAPLLAGPSRAGCKTFWSKLVPSGVNPENLTCPTRSSTCASEVIRSP